MLGRRATLLFLGSWIAGCLALGVLCAAEEIAESVVGCGGFVTASTGLTAVLKEKANYSFIKVKLLTSDEIVKHSTECAPNGYYFLPVYEKGTYVVAVATVDGWHFEPKQMAVTIGDDGFCNRGEDVNFRLTGFSVKGRVVVVTNGEEKPGPAGVVVRLSGVPPRETMTTAGGGYSFANVSPGTYTIEASHPAATFDPDKKSASVVIEWGNAEVPIPFVVTGFSVSGRVVSDGEPIRGVTFLLFFRGQEKEQDHQPVRSAVSDEFGQFLITNISTGEYVLLPRYSGLAASFAVEPSRVNVTVYGNGVEVADAFRVVGFSLRGRVLKGVGDSASGFTGAAVFVNGEKKTLTDSEGQYTLCHLTRDKRYDVTAAAPHTEFQSLLGMTLSPNMEALPDIVAAAFDVCGTAIFDHPAATTWANRQIIIQRVEGGDAVGEPHQSMTDHSGHFCTTLPPGQYTVSVRVTETERLAGLVPAPAARHVVVGEGPLLNVDFNEARVAVSGRVMCIEPQCRSDIRVTLAQTSGAWERDNRLPMTLPLSAVDSGKRDGGIGTFTFAGMLPGKYVLNVNMEHWCWRNRSLSVIVGQQPGGDIGAFVPSEGKSKDAAIAFAQSGFLLTSILSHDASLFFRLENAPESEQQSFQLSRGTNRFCLKKPGAYVLTPRGCVRFERDIYRYDTTSPQVQDMAASAYKVSGTITVAKEEGQSAAEVDVGVAEFADKEGTEKHSKTVVHAVRVPELDSDTRWSYEYSFWAEEGQWLEIVPRAVSHESKTLFYPSFRIFEVEKEPLSCLPAVEQFEGREGLMLQGEVTPSLTGVDICVRRVVDDEVVVVVGTDAEGRYIAGPLYDDVEYRVSAEREGYHFRSDRPGHFQALQLGGIAVSVLTVDNDPLPGVTLSLSGDGYRNNTAVPVSGTLAFRDLWPGQYFLRALLKEYEFEPATRTITVGEGQVPELKIVGRRVAFSVFGYVQSLSGEPEKMVTVEALGPENEYEQTQSDHLGRYRLRGLLPADARPGFSGEYVVRIRQGRDNARIARSSPASVNITMQRSDVHGVDMVAFMFPLRFDIFGSLDVEERFLPGLKVVVTPKTDGPTGRSIVSYDCKGTVGSTFVFAGLQKGAYRVELSTPLSTRDWDYVLPHVDLVLGHDSGDPVEGVQILQDGSACVRLSLQPQTAGEPSGGLVQSGVGLVALLACTLGLLFHKEIKDWYVGAPLPNEDDWAVGLAVPKGKRGTKSRRR